MTGSLKPIVPQIHSMYMLVYDFFDAPCESKLVQPYLTMDKTIDIILTISSNIPAQEPTTMSYIIHNGELTHNPITRILRALYVYPPIVAAIFAATGNTDHQPLQVKMSVAICSAQSKLHIHLLFKK